MEGLRNALKCVSDEYEQLPDSSELINTIHKKFLGYYDEPKLQGLSHLLSQEISLEAARQLAFSPSPAQIRSSIALVALNLETLQILSYFAQADITLRISIIFSFTLLHGSSVSFEFVLRLTNP
jgi:hypothetical protein